MTGGPPRDMRSSLPSGGSAVTDPRAVLSSLPTPPHRSGRRDRIHLTRCGRAALHPLRVMSRGTGSVNRGRVIDLSVVTRWGWPWAVRMKGYVVKVASKVVVIGETGLIGPKLVARLGDGHEAVPAAPNTGVNTLTGEGPAEVLDGAAVVVEQEPRRAEPSTWDAAAHPARSDPGAGRCPCGAPRPRLPARPPNRSSTAATGTSPRPGGRSTGRPTSGCGRSARTRAGRRPAPWTTARRRSLDPWRAKIRPPAGPLRLCTAFSGELRAGDVAAESPGSSRGIVCPDSIRSRGIGRVLQRPHRGPAGILLVRLRTHPPNRKMP